VNEATIAGLLAKARDVGLPLLEARMLLEHVSGLDRVRQMSDPDRELAGEQATRFLDLLGRRASGEPLAYLIGEREFFSLRFKVTPAVLIPRPETELLVELALERLPLDRLARALDLGTGSGAIPVAIKKHRPMLDMTAVDISAEALSVAKENAMTLGATVRLLQSDWFTALGDECFDVIVSNPPYIAEGDQHLGLGDLRFEPRHALTDGGDGLIHLRRIVADCPDHLEAGGWLLMEHGYDQAEACRQLLVARGFAEVQSWADLAGIERVSGGCWPG
jgi:release factor glutamine methyltransferase